MLSGPGATIGKARKLRRKMSLPEVLLWRELRKRPGGFKWRRQHPAGPFVLDFVCLEANLAIEIDGEAHGRGGNPARDEVRDEWLMAQGYRTWRVPAREVLGELEAVVRFAVHMAGQCRGPPNPPRYGEVAARRADGGAGINSAMPAQPLHQAPPGPPPRTGEDF
jgi:very-short-patch-repair endonuclease